MNTQNLKQLLKLIEELCEAVDNGSADIGGARRPLVILKDIGPKIGPARRELKELSK